MIISKKKFREEIALAQSIGRNEILNQNELDRKFEHLYNRINALEKKVDELEFELQKKKFTAVKKAVKGECQCKES